VISFLYLILVLQEQLAFSSKPGMLPIYSRKDFDRHHSPRVLDWAAFALMCVPSIVIPYMLWYSSASKYDKLAKASKTKTN
jgi:translocon-associated protein subunit beta